MSKKIEVITFRTDKETKEKLNSIANEKDWSVAQVVDKICKQHFSEKIEHKITIETEIDISIENVLKEQKMTVADLLYIFLDSLTADKVEEIASAMNLGIDKVPMELDTSIKEY